MIAQPVSIETGRSTGNDIQWGAGQDSFYEVFHDRRKLMLVPLESLYFMAKHTDGVIPRQMDFGSRKYHAQFIQLESGHTKSSTISLSRSSQREENK
jgi:hypothetical protein